MHVLFCHLRSSSDLKYARNIVKACNFHICALQYMHSLLTDDVAQTVAFSIVASRLDYCRLNPRGTLLLLQLQCSIHLELFTC